MEWFVYHFKSLEETAGRGETLCSSHGCKATDLHRNMS